jgi:hypothetical protein
MERNGLFPTNNKQIFRKQPFNKSMLLSIGIYSKELEDKTYANFKEGER